MWSETSILDDAAGWIELDESGWDALTVWAAGPGQVGRMPQDDSSRRVPVVCETGGVVIRSEEPFTPADRAMIEEGINGYLADAGIPPRPVGFTWFLRLPENWPVDRDLVAEINRIVLSSPVGRGDGVIMPGEWLGAMREALKVLYRRR